MRERGFRLSYPGTVLEFGGIDPTGDPFGLGLGWIGVTDYDVSATALTTEDTNRPRVDGIRMGQDFRGGRTHTFTLTVRGRTRAEAELLAGAAEDAWRGDTVRLTADTFAELTTMQGGAERTVLGRPRNFAPNYERLSSAYEVTCVATFETTDDTWYGAEESLRVDLRAINLDGFTFPVVFPLVMAQPTARAGQVSIGGTLPTAVVVELHGPLSNPTVSAGNEWSLQLRTNLAPGRVVTLDPRPWRRSITDQSGGSYAGALARPGRLSSMVLAPGPHQMVLSGQDSTGTAYMVVRWRPASSGRR